MCYRHMSAYVYFMFHVLFHHFHEIVTVAVSQTGCQCIDVNEPSRYLLTGGSDGIISVWDLKTKKVRKTYKVSKDSSNTCLMCFHSKGGKKYVNISLKLYH